MTINADKKYANPFKINILNKLQMQIDGIYLSDNKIWGIFQLYIFYILICFYLTLYIDTQFSCYHI